MLLHMLPQAVKCRMTGYDCVNAIDCRQTYVNVNIVNENEN